MTTSQNLMEISEDSILEKYPEAMEMLNGFDHAPRMGKAKEAPQKERSSGIGTRRRFRSTTPGLTTQSTAKPDGVNLMHRINDSDETDPLTSPVQH